MKSLFVIRDVNTGSFCSSSKSIFFDTDVNAASLFDSKQNAEKAIRSVMNFMTKAMNPYGGNTWSLTDDNNVETFFHSFKEEYIQMLESKPHLADRVAGNQARREAQLDLEVVEVKLTLVL
jgi:hypothetical protein